MSRYVALDKSKHTQLRVRQSYGAELGDSVSSVPVILPELSHLVADFPVVVIQSKDSGRYRLTALLGLFPTQNLFLQGDSWDASYVPLNLQVRPFRMGRRPDDANNTSPFVMVDADSPRLSQDQGEVLFDDGGSPSDYLRRQGEVLSLLADGQAQVTAFVDYLMAKELLEETRVSFNDHNGEKKTLTGMFAVSQKKSNALDLETVTELHSKGWIEAFYLMKASMAHLRSLVHRYQRLDTL